MNHYELLFNPLNIGSVTIPNRIVMTAMGVDVSAPDGRVTPETVAYYTARAKGGVGLIVTEYCRVNESDGACATGQLSLSHDRYIPGMQKLTESVHQHGTKIFVQLQHPGRQSVPVFPTFWPSLERIQKIWPGVWNAFYKTLSSVSTDAGTTDPVVLKKQQRFLKPVLAPSVLPPEEDDGALSSVKTRAFTTKEIRKLIQQFKQRTGYLLQNMFPEASELIQKQTELHAKVRFGPREKGLRNDEIWMVSDTILPLSPIEMEKVK